MEKIIYLHALVVVCICAFMYAMYIIHAYCMNYFLRVHTRRESSLLKKVSNQTHGVAALFHQVDIK